MPKVTFVKEKHTIEVPEGAILRDEALKAGIALHRGFRRMANCRGHGTCATCRVLVTNGMENLSPKRSWERCRLGVSWVAIGFEDQMRLACQTKVYGDIEVETQPRLHQGKPFW